MSRRRFPPLKGLKAFETVARLGSFNAAAGELNVTRSAVSHQIRALEDAIGFSLFERDTRPARLTDAGQAYFPVVRDAFDTIEQSTRALALDRSDDELVIQVYVTVALKWLIPRLHDFERRHPAIRVRLSTSYVEWNFDREHADVGFILSRRKDAGLHYSPLFRAMLTPLCSPSLLQEHGGAMSPEDLRHHTVLHVYTADEDWRTWLDAAGVSDIAPSGRIAFDSYVLAQQAAEEGHGVAMTLGPFAREELQSGRLVKPFQQTVPHEHWWELVCTEQNRDLEKVRSFRAWVIEQVRLDPEIEEHS